MMTEVLEGPLGRTQGRDGRLAPLGVEEGSGGETALSKQSRRWSCHEESLPLVEGPGFICAWLSALSWLLPALVITSCKGFWETGLLV